MPRKTTASPPPTGTDEWLDELRVATLSDGPFEYDKTLESQGLDSLDIMEVVCWMEEKYLIEYSDKQIAKMKDRTFRQVRADAERLAKKTAPR